MMTTISSIAVKDGTATISPIAGGDVCIECVSVTSCALFLVPGVDRLKRKYPNGERMHHNLYAC